MYPVGKFTSSCLSRPCIALRRWLCIIHSMCYIRVSHGSLQKKKSYSWLLKSLSLYPYIRLDLGMAAHRCIHGDCLLVNCPLIALHRVMLQITFEGSASLNWTDVASAGTCQRVFMDIVFRKFSELHMCNQLGTPSVLPDLCLSSGPSFSQI
jgi:hypothetical protein